MTELAVQGLHKRLGDHLAVDRVSFQVTEGELFVLLGPSGCGKTTTLRMICGLVEPDGGQISIAGRDVTRLPPRERNVGMVFQEYGLYPSMDVFGNMAYGLEARGKHSKREIEGRVLDAAERLGLTDLLRQPIADLSGGEQQRIALGRAMVKDADAYLFDEPLSNLDPKLRHRVRRDIVALHRMKGKPSVYVTHDQTEAFAMADTIAVMGGGRLQQVGSPTDLVENPASVFVARFVGSPPMNLVSARLGEVAGSGQAVTFGDTTIRLSPGRKRALADYGKTDVTVGIRPDNLAPQPDGAGAPSDRDGGTIAGEIVDVEPLIGETVVRLRAAGDTTFAAVLRGGAENGVAVGQRLRLGVSGDQVRLFDPESEQALTP